MYTVYILRNTISGRHYIGSTKNIERRLSEHNRGQTRSTRQGEHWVLIYREDVNSNAEARGREFQIKSFKGGNAFKKLIKR